MNTRIAVATAIGCLAALPLLGLGPEYVGRAAGVQKPTKGPASFATYIKLPSLGSNAEANGINDAGTVIVGRSFDRAGLLYAVKWTQQNGTWVISALPAPVPYPGSAAARGIDNFGNVAGFAASSPRRPVYWPAAGGSSLLGCDSDVGETHAISANGQIIVGWVVGGQAAAWYSPGSCTEFLPPLEEGGSATAYAVTGDGNIIGGRAARGSQQTHVPVRWVVIDGQRQVQQVDTRPGSVRGANESGDLAGTVAIACPAVDGCQRAVIWSASGAVTQLETLGGQYSSAVDINAEGEVVGTSTTSRGDFTAYFWSASTGMLQLPAIRGGLAFALSDVRPDGTRLVVGTSQASAGVWIVRNP
ncbi:MAG: hypothetical protein H0W08_11075 [Acidobacteria bacterium]|nr:hypothetical protein [Acidobacteriota bacterium]